MKKSALILAAAFASVAAFGGEHMFWQDNNVSVLSGGNFELDAADQTTMTLEHASGWSVGDMYMFLDTIYFHDAAAGSDDYTYYGEIAPRLSAGKILDKDLSVLFIKDFLFATTFEFGKDADESLLLGLGLDLDIPGFDFFQVNAYRRFNDMKADTDEYQITPVWRMTIPAGSTSVVFDGYIDWVLSENTDHFHFNPQLKLDLGALVGMDAAKLYIGVEYDYWKNKYGVRDGDGLDTDQNALSGIVQYHF